nr:PREDICTED: retinol dehydrogenase 11-like [Bemisia tabaci]
MHISNCVPSHKLAVVMVLRVRLKTVLVFALLVRFLGIVECGSSSPGSGSSVSKIGSFSSGSSSSKSGSSGGLRKYLHWRNWHIPRIMSLFYKKYKGEERMDGKVAIITGSNTGIGKVTALEFCKRGARVIMACRNTDTCKEAADDILNKTKELKDRGTVVCKYLDLSKTRTIREFAADIMRTEEKINYLINNAGVMACKWGLTADQQEMQFAVNFLGHYLLTLKLLPRIIKSAPSRIVNVASLAHIFSSGNMHYDDIQLKKKYNPRVAYGRSKLANIWFTRELARRLTEKRIKTVTTYALHPGVIATELSRHLDTAARPWIKKLYESRFVRYFIRTPEEGAQTTLHCALNAKAANETGRYYSNCHKAKPNKTARDDKRAKELWDWSWDKLKIDEGDYDPFSPQ